MCFYKCPLLVPGAERLLPLADCIWKGAIVFFEDYKISPEKNKIFYNLQKNVFLGGHVFFNKQTIMRQRVSGWEMCDDYQATGRGPSTVVSIGRSSKEFNIWHRWPAGACLCRSGLCCRIVCTLTF